MAKGQHKGRLFGDFLVKNGVITSKDLSNALNLQKEIFANMSIQATLEALLSREELQQLVAQAGKTNKSLEEAAIQAGVLSKIDIQKLKKNLKDYRVPLGMILYREKVIDFQTLQTWLKKFENQKLNNHEVIPLLKKIPLFADLSESRLKQISPRFQYRYVEAGNFLFLKGDPGEGIYLLESGLIRLNFMPGEESVKTDSIQSGDYFGLAGAMQRSPRMSDAIAILDSVLWFLSDSDLHEIIEKNPKMGIKVALRICESLRVITRGEAHATRALSRLSVVIFPSKHAQLRLAGVLGKSFIENLQTDISGQEDEKLLLVNTLPDYSSSSPSASESRQTFPRPTPVKDLKNIYSVNLPEQEQEENVDQLSQWLRRQSKRYGKLMFLITPGNIKFRKLIMGMADRCVILLQEEIPEFIRYTSPGRDRVYILESDNRKKDLELFGTINQICPEAAMPNLLTRDKEIQNGDMIARWLNHKSVGIAFGGGGARALAHVGVVEILERTGLIVDMISGTSAGAHMGGLYSLGLNTSEVLEMLEELAFQKYSKPFSDYTIPLRSLSRGRKYRRLLQASFEKRQTCDTLLPFFPIATKMRTGEEIVPGNIPLWRAILASGSVPAFLPLVKDKGEYYGDGGLVNNVPASILKRYRTDFVISLVTSGDPAKNDLNPRGFGSVLLQTMDIMVKEATKKYMRYTDFSFSPDIGAFSGVDYSQGPRLIELGKKTALASLYKLQKALEKKDIRINIKDLEMRP